MNALYIVCGLGLTALLAEVFNIRKILGVLIIIGLAAAIGFTVTEWGTSISYFTNMVVFDDLRGRSQFSSWLLPFYGFGWRKIISIRI